MGSWLSSWMGGNTAEGKSAKSVDNSEDSGSGVRGDVDQEAAVPDGPQRVPGIIPFTTVVAEPSLADVLYDEALVRGWLSCIDKVRKKRRERWCAVHENFLYEFEPVQSEMLERAKHSLEGSICWIPEGSKDTFIVHVGGMFQSLDRNAGENEISYTVDDPSTLKDWVDGITVSSVLKMMGRIGGVPALIQEREDIRFQEERDRELKDQRREERRRARREAQARGAGSDSASVTSASTAAVSVTSNAKSRARAGGKGVAGADRARGGRVVPRAGGDSRGGNQGAERGGGEERQEAVAEALVMPVRAPRSLMETEETLQLPASARERARAGTQETRALKPPKTLTPAEVEVEVDGDEAGTVAGGEEENAVLSGHGGSRDDSAATTEERSQGSISHRDSATPSVASSEERKLRVERIRVIAVEGARQEAAGQRAEGDLGRAEEAEEAVEAQSQREGSNLEE